MRSVKYTSIKRVIGEFLRQYPELSTDEGLLTLWIAKALDLANAPAQYVNKVTYRVVDNYSAELPCDHVDTIMLLKYNKVYTPKTLCNIINTVEQEAPREEEQPTNSCCQGLQDEATNVWINLEDCLYSYAITFGNTDLLNSLSSNSSADAWSNIRLTEDVFFNDKEELPNGITGIYQNVTDEYTVLHGKTLKFSFPTGFVAISYKGYVTDKEGYPMIPDNESFRTATEKYILYKIAEKDFYAGRQGAGQRLQKAEADWHWYIRQYKNNTMMQTIDEMQNRVNNDKNVYDRYSYESLFSNLNKQQKFNGR